MYLKFNSNKVLNLYLRPLKERRKVLEDNMKEIPGRIMLSQQTFVTVSLKL